MSKKKKMFSVGSSIGIIANVAKGILIKPEPLPEGFTLTAHTGCEGTKNNSLNSVTAGAVAGADIVEIDLFITDNGEMLLSHGTPVGGEFTLEQAFSHIRGFAGLKVNIDVKTDNDLSPVVALAEKYGLSDRIFFTGIDKEKTELVKNTAPEISFYFNASVDASLIEDDSYIDELSQEVISMGALGLNIKYCLCSKKMVEAFHSKGLKVSLWTVDNRFDMKRILKLCPDNITTRKPTEYKKTIASVMGEDVL